MEGRAETDERARDRLRARVEENYRTHGVDAQTIRHFLIHNRQVEELVALLAAEEGFDERESEIALLGAILHDAAKGYGEFLAHGEAGGALAEQFLREAGVSPELAASVRLAIERHMGQEGYPADRAREKFGQDFHYPAPRTRVGELLYECDLLTQLTEAGLAKIIALRAADDELVAEDEAAAGAQGSSVEAARLASALASARRSFELITAQEDFPLAAVQRQARAQWEGLRERYPQL